MATSSIPLKLHSPSLTSLPLPYNSNFGPAPNNHPNPNSSFLSPNPKFHASLFKHQSPCSFRTSHRFSHGNSVNDDDDDDGDAQNCSFDEAVALFNAREYYRCHDFLEALWNRADEPARTLIHGILQCAVGFHHLFNQNHRGAMMELGEGLCKLRKMNFESGPFYQFELEISAVLDFIYQTQLELAACADDLCLAMDQSERSYQLLGGYAAGQRLYCLESGPSKTMYIVFCPDRSYGTIQLRVKLPTLNATEECLMACEYN